MGIFYHLDRRNALKPDFILPLYQPSFLDNWDSERIALFKSRYPDGLTNHGLHYLGEDPMLGVNLRSREQLLEVVRCQEFSDRPSRFTSYFSCESLKDAVRLHRNGLLFDGTQHSNPPIWKIEAAESFRADMNHFLVKNGPLSTAKARSYWMQLASPDPFGKCF